MISKNFNRLIKSGFFHIFGSNTINQIVNFAYGILIVRVISKEEYGIFSYASNIYSMLMLLSGFGIVSAILQVASEFSGKGRNPASLLQYGYRFGIKFNIGLSFLILLIALLIPLPIIGSNRILGMMFLLPVPMIIKDLQIVWLRANLQNKAFGTANTVNAVLVSLFTLLGAWLLKNNGIVIGQYLAVFIMLWMLWKRYDVPLIGAEEDLPLQDKKDLFTIAGISTLNNALSQMLTLLGTFMLGLIISNPVMIASYKVASAIPMALNFIPSALMVYLYPYFARNRHNKAWVKSKYKTILLFAGMANLFISIIGIVFAEQIIRIIFGDSYSDATLPFQVLMGSYFISGTFRTISGNLLVTQRKLKVNTVNGIVGAVVSIVMNAILIPGRGSMGAAISYLITMIITSLIAVYYFSAAINEIGVEQVL